MLKITIKKIQIMRKTFSDWWISFIKEVRLRNLEVTKSEDYIRLFFDDEKYFSVEKGIKYFTK